MALNCPVCGAAAPQRLRYAKLVVCAHCQTSLFLEDDAVRNVGAKAALVEAPSILELGRRFEYRGWLFEALGRVQFDYGDGIWEEWWVQLDHDGGTGGSGGRWVSVDEGEIAIESPVAAPGDLPAFDDLAVGQEVGVLEQRLRVTEKNRSVCIGLAGELPEVIAAGDVHRYVHLSGRRGELVTLEYQAERTYAYRGAWIDPFELRAL